MRKSFPWTPLLVAASTAVGQTTPAPHTPGLVVASGQLGAAPSVFLMGGGPTPVKGAPYSAEQVSERVQTLADGTHITQTTQKTMLYRDGEGRTRTERTFMPPAGAVMATGLPPFVEILDPVAGYRYSLDARNRIARRSTLPPTRNRNAATAMPSAAVRQQAGTFVLGGNSATATASSGPASSRPHPDISQESLGTQNIEGLTADGSRIKVTYPAGFFGNDRPISTVTETWTSKALQTQVLSTTSDPRNGETTTKLTNVSQAEPDPTLFQVPPEYTVEDQPEPRVIRNPPAN